jgi:8-amino-7-oxononanoate synthase
VTDFTSALYLGVEHATWQLAEWERLTLGKPAALTSPPGAVAVEEEVAALMGCERALLAPSTLHLFWDLLALLAGRGANLFVDGGSYPIARWGVERAAALGTPVKVFRRHDVKALRVALAATEDKPPIVVADGFCPACGTPAPLLDYLQCVAERDGLVVIDDTQALGVFGHSPGPYAPYGCGGGGSLRLAGIRDRRVVVASSLAKAFGAPVAMLAGADELVSEFESKSATRVHCSPPSAAAIAAAAHALAINRRAGEHLRHRLAQLVARFRQGLWELNLIASSSLFPVQPLRLPAGVDVRAIHEGLLKRGVEAVLHRRSDGREALISFVLTARHSFSEIDHAVACLTDVVGREPRSRWKGAKGNGESIRGSNEALPSLFGTPGRDFR